MPDRSFVYRIEIDGRQAGPAAARVRRDIQRELSQVRFTPQAQAPRAGSSLPSFAAGGGQSGFAGVGNLRQLAGLSIGGFAVTQMAQATLEAGKLGAENVRLARSYEALAKGAGLAGDTLLNKLSAATQKTVTEQTLMASTNMLLAASQEGQIKVTEQQIATLAKFARLRSTQLTANGRPMSTEEAYGRLVQGVVKRETELLDELGLSTKQLADQLGVPLKEVNSDVESLLTAITQVAEVEIDRFGEPILDEAARIEQAATRIEEAKNRINAALAEPVARVYEVAANTADAAVNGPGSLQMDATRRLLQERIERQKRIEEASNFGIGNGDGVSKQRAGMEMLDQLIGKSQELGKAGQRGANIYDEALLQLATTISYTGQVSEEQASQMAEVERYYKLLANGGIVLAETNKEIGDSAKYAAGQVFELAAGLFQVSQNGQLVKVPAFGPATQPPSVPNTNAVEGIFGGTLLGSAMQGPNAFQKNYGSAYRQNVEDEQRATEQAQREAIRNNETAWKSAAESVRQDFRDAAEELKSTIMSIPGVVGTSQVTSDQLKMAEFGLPQNFADDIRRRLEDEVINRVDYADINPAELFGRAGIDLSLPDEAKVALFNQKWADSSLFADKANLDLFNQDAIRAALEQQKMSELGQQNIFSMFGLGEDSQGAYFADLGGIMAGGMKAGAEDGLAEFGRDAIANVVMQLKTDSALTEYAALGGEIGGAIWGGVIDSTGSSSIVSAIVTEVLAQINDYLPPE